MEGVHDVVVGYAGGKAENPTYRNIQDYTEAVRITFDPTIMSYDTIIRSFFVMQGGPPRVKKCKRQYRSAILVHNEEQRQVSLRVIEEIKGDGPVCTDVEDATAFYKAEAYHQKFMSRMSS